MAGSSPEFRTYNANPYLHPPPKKEQLKPLFSLRILKHAADWRKFISNISHFPYFNTVLSVENMI